MSFRLSFNRNIVINTITLLKCRMGLNELRQIHAFFNRRVYKWISCLYAPNGIMNQDISCFIRRRVCKSKLSFFSFTYSGIIYFNSLFMDEKRKGSDFLSFFKFFTTCLVFCVFSITCPLAKQMSSILTTAYCP